MADLCTMHRPYLLCMLPLKVRVISEQGNQKPLKMCESCNPVSQSSFAAVSSEFCIQKSFKTPGEDDSASQNILVRNADKPCTFLLHRDWTTNVMASSPRAWPLSYFFPKKCYGPRKQETIERTWYPHFQVGGWVVFGLSLFYNNIAYLLFL